jgi:hypothetical protein
MGCSTKHRRNLCWKRGHRWLHAMYWNILISIVQPLHTNNPPKKLVYARWWNSWVSACKVEDKQIRLPHVTAQKERFWACTMKTKNPAQQSCVIVLEHCSQIFWEILVKKWRTSSQIDVARQYHRFLIILELVLQFPTFEQALTRLKQSKQYCWARIFIYLSPSKVSAQGLAAGFYCDVGNWVIQGIGETQSIKHRRVD